MPIASPRYPFNDLVAKQHPIAALGALLGSLSTVVCHSLRLGDLREPLSRAAEIIDEFQKAFNRRPAFNASGATRRLLAHPE